MTNSESLFMVQSNHLAALTARHRIPALYAYRENAIAGGLMSYGSKLSRRVLKGEKPADLPVIQSSKFDLVINLKTAKMLGLTVPYGLLNAADEVIE
jgi:putative ABC transport system substrate-binding protein